MRHGRVVEREWMAWLRVAWVGGSKPEGRKVT